MTGRQLKVAWQESQAVLERMCVVLLPVARVPSWQLAQVVARLTWLNVAGFQAVVAWQVPQAVSLGMWFTCLPAARTPSWHEAQAPFACV